MPATSSGALPTLLALLALGLAAAPAHADVAISFTGGTLAVTGDAAANTIVVRPGSDPSQLTIDVSGDGTIAQSVPVASVTGVEVSGGDGDDRLSVDVGTAPVTQVLIDGGAGRDTIEGSQQSDTIDGGPGDDTITAGRGQDIVSGGAGADIFTWMPGDGSDTIDGGTGPDELIFTGANTNEHFEVDPDGTHVRLTRDVASITMNLSSVERLELNALDGQDSLIATPGLRPLIAIDADLGPGDDSAQGATATTSSTAATATTRCSAATGTTC